MGPVSGEKMKKIKLSTLINIILAIALMAVVGFGWFYLKKQSPIEKVTSALDITDSVPNPKYLYTIYGPDSKRLNHPYNLVVVNDRIYITDTDNGRVIITDYNGKFIKEFGKSGGQGNLEDPIGITAINDEIYVVDPALKKILVYDLDGNFKRYFKSDYATSPVNIAYHDGKFYVLDTGAKTTVHIVSPEGKVLKQIGKRGGDSGEFYFPLSIKVDDKGQIWIADSNNNRIQVIDENGKSIKVLLGKEENGTGGYAIPRGLAFDKKGYMYTCETLSNMVAITDEKGIVVKRFSYAEDKTVAGEPDSLELPNSVFIDDNLRLYVVEYGNSRVLVYDLK